MAVQTYCGTVVHKFLKYFDTVFIFISDDKLNGVSIGRYVSVPTSQCSWQMRICTDLSVQLADTFNTNFTNIIFYVSAPTL